MFMIPTATGAQTFPLQDEVVEGCEANLSIIPSARSSETVRRQETSDSGSLIENLLWKSTTDRNRQVNQSDLRQSSQTAKLECTNACMQPLIGVCGKIVARSGSLGLNDHKKPIIGVTFRESLPHPSKLRKKRRKQLKNPLSVRQSQQGFDVMAHVAQLRRKQAEFNWLPSYEKDDILSSRDLVEEEPCPPGSTGPQRVPSTPTLLSNEKFELHPPLASHNAKGRANMDLFNAYYQLPQVPTGQSSIPSYAVARRERPVVQLKEEELYESPYYTRHKQMPNTDSFSPAMEQKSLAAWLNPESSKLKRFHPIISEPPKEE